MIETVTTATMVLSGKQTETSYATYFIDVRNHPRVSKKKYSILIKKNRKKSFEDS